MGQAKEIGRCTHAREPSEARDVIPLHAVKAPLNCLAQSRAAVSYNSSSSSSGGRAHAHTAFFSTKVFMLITSKYDQALLWATRNEQQRSNLSFTQWLRGVCEIHEMKRETERRQNRRGAIHAGGFGKRTKERRTLSSPLDIFIASFTGYTWLAHLSHTLSF